MYPLALYVLNSYIEGNVRRHNVVDTYSRPVLEAILINILQCY